MRIASKVRIAAAAGVTALCILFATALSNPLASAQAEDTGNARESRRSPSTSRVPNARDVSTAASGVIGRLPDDTGSPELFGPDLDRTLQDLGASTQPGRLAANGAETPTQINLVFHVLEGRASEGDLSDAVLAAQAAVLNDAYRESGIHLNIAEVRRYADSPYFAGGCFPTTAEGLRMKSELAVDPARFVNIYTCELALPYIAGYGTLPDEFPEADARHGIVIDYRTLTGSPAPFEPGHTLVHELGHYFGLLHTFQGGCTEPGDGVSDTPAEATPAYGCPVDRDSCAQNGPDPVTNFMDYSDDACTDRFTPLQNSRMLALIAAYRPSLSTSGFAIGPGITGNWFNPAESGHGFIVEVLPENRMLAEWFVFAPGGGPVWIVALGTIAGDTATLQGYQVAGPGGRFPPDFDSSQVQNQPWGTLVLRFTDCNNGQASWQPTAQGYASGSMPIVRLTMPAGLACP